MQTGNLQVNGCAWRRASPYNNQNIIIGAIFSPPASLCGLVSKIRVDFLKIIAIMAVRIFIQSQHCYGTVPVVDRLLVLVQFHNNNKQVPVPQSGKYG